MLSTILRSASRLMNPLRHPPGTAAYAHLPLAAWKQGKDDLTSAHGDIHAAWGRDAGLSAWLQVSSGQLWLSLKATAGITTRRQC